MGSRFYFSVAVIALLWGPCQILHAQVEEWNMGKLQIGEQTADNTSPSGPLEYEFFAQLFTANGTDFNSVTLNGPVGSGVSEPLEAHVFATNEWEFFETFGSQAGMDAAYPAGTYTLDTSGGSVGTASEAIVLGPTMFPTQPFFTGSVYSTLQGMDPSQPFSFQWNTPSGNKWLFNIEEEVGGFEVFFTTSDDLGAAATGVTLPAGTLQPGVQYKAFLGFGNLTEDQPDGFTTGIGFAAPAQVSFTFASFQTGDPIPSPSAMVLLVSLLGSVGASRSRRG